MQNQKKFRKSFLPSIFYGIILIAIAFSSVLFSCSRGSSETTQEDHAKIVNSYKQTLSKDEDFIKNFQADQTLSGYLKDSTIQFDEKSYQTLLTEVSKAKTDNELIAAFKNYNISNAENIVDLFIEKRNALSRVRRKYPKLSYLSRTEFNQLFMESYRSVIVYVPTAHAPGCSTNCCDAYVSATGDCDVDFIIATGFSLLGASIATVTATPIVGAATATAGIAAAYMTNMRCMATAASGYRSCMGYQ
jgi:hypothetical protein